MITKFKPLKKLKDLFKPSSSCVSEIEESEIGAIVYHKIRGSLSILLFKDKRGRWSIPSSSRRENETSAQSIIRTIEEKTGLIELKIWQTLGQISFSDSKYPEKKLNNLQIFLIQALTDPEKQMIEEELKDALWLPATEALDRIDYEDITKMIVLAVAKIKRAQI